jgi:GST-like protein
LVDPQGPDGKHLVLNESATTLIYLAEKFGKLLPAAADARARTFEQLFSYDPGMGSALGQSGLFLKPMPEHLSLATSRASTEVLQLAKRLDRVLSERIFLAGDEFSIADIAHFCWFRRRDFAGLDLNVVPNLKRWSEHIVARPAIQRAIARIEAFSARHRLPDRTATDPLVPSLAS